MRVLVALTVAAAAWLGAFPASAGAFGIEMGTPLTKLSVVKKLSEFSYAVKAPLPNKEFETYLVLLTPGQGVCKVSAIGRDHDADAFGTSVQSAFGDLRTALSSKYGKSLDYDFLKAGSIWDGSREWTMAVRQKERVMSSFWTRDEGATLPADLSGIMLEVKATSSTTAYLYLTYEFANIDACGVEIKKVDNRGL